MTVGDAAAVREALFWHPDGATYSRREHALAALDRLVAEVERLQQERDEQDERERIGAKNFLVQLDWRKRVETERDAALAEAGKLRAAGEMLIAWDSRWPGTRIYSATQFQACHDGLTECVSATRAALAGSDAPLTDADYAQAASDMPEKMAGSDAPPTPSEAQ